MMGAGKKRCTKGKSCGATCIAKGYLCIMELGPELSAMLKDVRKLWGSSGRMSDWDTQLDSSGRARRIEKLYEVYKKLPEGPQKERVKQRIQNVENTRLAKRERSRLIGEVGKKDFIPDDVDKALGSKKDKERWERESKKREEDRKKVEEELDSEGSWYQGNLNRYRRSVKG